MKKYTSKARTMPTVGMISLSTAGGLVSVLFLFFRAFIVSVSLLIDLNEMYS